MTPIRFGASGDDVSSNSFFSFYEKSIPTTPMSDICLKDALAARTPPIYLAPQQAAPEQKIRIGSQAKASLPDDSPGLRRIYVCIYIYIYV